ncbi:MAG: 50S ribosomal protein L23 [bacterium]|nr:50S ribosomal protein L23 [bacterium]
MSLFFKKTKKEESFKDKKKSTSAKASADKKERKVVEEKSAPIKTTAGKAKKVDIKLAPSVLSRPQITEKATFLMEKNQYIFQAFKTATKPEVKKAVQEVYGVVVEKVRIINVDRKKKRLGRTTGWKKGYKKAIVTIKKGQEIEIIPR